MGDQEKPGIGTAVDQAMAIRAAEDDEQEVEQAELLPPLVPRPDLSEPAEGQVVTRGPGRPKGAANKRTIAWRDHLLSRHRSPLEVLASYTDPDPVALAEYLACDKLDAAKLQIACASKLAGFTHSEMPKAIQVDDKRTVLHISIGGLPMEEALDAAMRPEDGVLQIEGEAMPPDEDDEEAAE